MLEILFQTNTMNALRFSRRQALGAISVIAAGTHPLRHVLAQADDFPNKPIRLIAGFAAGGSGDALARALVPEVSRLLGQSLVIENRPGAATNIASDYVAKAAPDGYTLLLGGSFSHAVNPALFAKLPFDPVKNFAPLMQVTAGGGQVIVVPASLPVNSLPEFIAYAKREGDKVNYASAGLGSPGHIAGAYFNQRAGLSMTHIAYKGASEAIRDLVAGTIQMTITAPTAAMALVKDGRLKALAQTTPQRSRFLQDVPAMEELGMRDINIDGWYGLFAPAGTPAPVMARLHGAFGTAMQEAGTRQRVEAASLSMATVQSSESFSRFVQDEIRRWQPIVRASGAVL
jgi:tripartite-type tricarboxylate transporter receptor subunit TctC